MDNDSRQHMTILDQMVADDNLQMMKAALPYIAPQEQHFLSVFTKFLELQKTMSLFQNSKAEITMMSTPEAPVDPLDMLIDIRQYAGFESRDSIDSLINALKAVQLFQIYQDNNE